MDTISVESDGRGEKLEMRGPYLQLTHTACSIPFSVVG